MAGKELRVTIAADDKASPVFTQVANAAKSFAQALDDAGKQGEQSFSRVDKGVQQAAAPIKDLTADLSKVAGLMTAAGGAITAAFVAPMVKGSLAAWDQVRSVQQATVALKAYETNAGAVKTVLTDLVKYARSDMGVLFQRQDLFAAAQGLKVMGAETENLTRYVEIMSRSVGIGAASWADLTQVIGRVGATGQLTGDDFDSLTKAGFRLDQSLRNTKVTWDELFAALDKGIPATAMEGQAKTIDGMMIRLQSSIRNLGVEFLQIDKDTSEFIAGGLGDRLSQGIEQARQVMLSLAPAAQMAGEGVAILATAGAGLVDMYLALPGPIQTAAAVMGSLSGVALTLGGALLLLAPRIAETIAAFRALGGISGILGGLGALMNPIVLAVAGIGLAIGAGAYLWKRHQDEVKATQQAYADLSKSIAENDKVILDAQLNMNPQANAALGISQFVRKQIDDVTASFAASKGLWQKAFTESLDLSNMAAGVQVNTKPITDFFDTVWGKAALDWGKNRKDNPISDMLLWDLKNGSLTESTRMEASRLMDDFYSAFQVTPQQLKSIEDSMKPIYDTLLANPDLDVEKVQSRIGEILSKSMVDGKIDVDSATAALTAFNEELNTTAGKAENANQALLAMRQAFAIDDMRIAGKGKLVEDVQAVTETLDHMQQGWTQAQVSREKLMTLPADDQFAIQMDNQAAATASATNAVNMYGEARARIIQKVAEGNLDNERLNSDLQAIHQQYLVNIASGMDRAKALELEAAATNELSQGLSVYSTQLSIAEQAHVAAAAAMDKAAEAIKKIKEAQKDAISGWMEATGNDDFVSQLNLAGLGTEYTQLAGNIANANTALADGFRVIVENTNAIGQQAQGVQDWADKLIGAAGTYAQIDDLLAAGTITLNEYNAAQQAQADIATANAAIQQDVLTIQAKQAPLIAELTQQQAAYMDELAKQPAAQQLVTLGWMDANEAAKANQILTMAAAAAQGEYGAQATASIEQMIIAQAKADPILKGLLLDMGLISQGADGTITVNFDSAVGAKTTLDDLNNSILTLADYLDNGVIDGSIDIKVKGREDMEQARKDAEALAAKDGTTVGINMSVNYTGLEKPGTGGYIDMGSQWADDAGITVPVTGEVKEVKPPAEGTDAGTVEVKGQVTEVEVPETVSKTITVDADTSAAMEKIANIGAALDTMSTANISIPVSVDVSDDVSLPGWLQPYMPGTSGEGAASFDPITIQVGIEVDGDTSLPGWLLPYVPGAAGEGAASFDPITMTVTIEATDNASDKVKSVQDAADKLGATNAVVSLSAVNGASSVILGAQTLADTFGETSVSATLGAVDNASSVIQGVLDLLGSVSSKTVALNVVTTYSSVGTPSGITSGDPRMLGGMPGYALGGVLFRGGEAGAELAHFAGGGVALVPNDGLYWAPQGTRIEPANSAATKLRPGGGLGGGRPIYVQIYGNVYGLDDLEVQVGGAVVRALAEEKRDRDRALGVAAA